jgi:O-antigen/teichoic acid export membrane protein
MSPALLAWRLDAMLFPLSLGLLAALWLGYPAVVALVARWRPFRPRRVPLEAGEEAWPQLTVIVSAYNEAAYIEARILDLWRQDYPAARYEILVSEDGSDDGTGERVRRLAAQARDSGVARAPLRLLSSPQRLGKAAAVNRAVAAARGSVVVLTDANNAYAPQALRHLAAPFADARVGAVVGRKAVAADTGVGGGESVYWRYEAWLTACESAAGSAVSAYGEALALRRELWTPLPPAGNDDLYALLQVLLRRHRVVAASGARSLELPAASEADEWERRQRMAAGRWSALACLRGRWRQLGWARAAQVACHQLLRPISALWLGVALLSGMALLAGAREVNPILVWLAWAQASGYAVVAAVAVGRANGARLGRLEAPYFFCLAMAASLGGWWRYLRRGQSPLWKRSRRAAPPGEGPAPAPAHGHILRGLFWASSSFLLGKVLVFGSIVVLARLLAPRAFGEVALAVSSVTVLEILGTLGLTSALIYEERDWAAGANLCFWVTLATSLAETALAWGLAPALAGFFHEPGLAPMLRVLSLSLVLTAAGNTHDTLLRRDLAFRRKLVPDLAQAAAKGGAAIALAALGYGAWSLIWGQVLGTVVVSAVLWGVQPWRPAWPPLRRRDRAVARRMIAYAKHIYLLDGSSVLLSNLDTLTIGRMLSDVWLGFYTLAFRVPEVVLFSVLNVISRVVFPAFSRLQGERAQLRATVLETARYTALLTLPMAAGLALLARPIVYGIYGWHWTGSIPVLEVLALYGALRCLTHNFGDGYKAMGRPDILAKMTLALWLLLIPSLILGARWGGIVGVAWGQVVTRVLISLLHVYLVGRFLDISPADLWRCFRPAIEATAAMAAAVLAARPLCAAWAPRVELAAMVPLGMAVYTLTLALRHPPIVRAALRQLGRRGEAPAPIAVATGAAAPAAPEAVYSEDAA